MRVLVSTSTLPFVGGGNVVIAQELVAALRRGGHEAEMWLCPSNPFGRQISAYLANWCTALHQDGLGRPIDRLVSIRYPSFALRHPSHVCWLNHRLREYYDLWEQTRPTLSARGRLITGVRRFVLHRVDNYLLRHNVDKLFVQSETIRRRLERWGNIRHAEVLYPPPPFRPYRHDGYGDFILAVSRLETHKRIDLLLRALPLCRSAVQVVVAGAGNAEADLRRLVRESGMEKRVEFRGEVDEEEKLSLYASCRLVFFAPYQEDYGFVTLEAFASAKGVLTCTDSGGPAEIVRHGENGLLTAPTPAAVAAAIDGVWEDDAAVASLGQAAARLAAAHTWERVVARFTAERP